MPTFCVRAYLTVSNRSFSLKFAMSVGPNAFDPGPGTNLSASPAGDVQSGFEKRSGSLVAFLTSLVFHVTLLLILACLVYTAGKKSRGILVAAELGESTETGFSVLESFELKPQADEETVQVQQDFEIDIDLDGLLKPDTIDSGNDSAIDAKLTSVSVDNAIRSLKIEGRERGASFFGSYAEGNRFVYVIDSSRSMKGERWTYACNQLIDSLNGLRPGQEFFVICFDIEPGFLFGTPPERVKFLKAEKDTVTRVRRWLRSRELGRATMPASALYYALQLNPDAVFLLSDGELQDNSQGMLRQINSGTSEQRQIPVHTVHLFSLQGRLTLEEIAMENNGSFTPIEGHKGYRTLRRR